jgi:recombinational DNA repair ATPase RecF
LHAAGRRSPRGGRSHRLEIRLIATLNGTDLRSEGNLIDGSRARQRDSGRAISDGAVPPQDLNIIDGSPSERRRFLDAA